MRYAFSSPMRFVLGDCLDVLPTFKESSFDAVVTDPPYGLKFMGKLWDRGVPGVPFWEAALRVAKPGAFLLAFGGTRTYHRLTCAIEDAGWEVRDCLMWLQGQGFPRSTGSLKPGWEPIVLARRRRSVAPQLQIDVCRTDTGRWPANVVLDEYAASLVDQQTGVMRDGVAVQRNGGGQTIGGIEKRTGSGSKGMVREDAGYGGSGGGSRFFYTAKASKGERTHGGTIENAHPTVKPLALMTWLLRLVTPPGGRVLDPFCGSGSTGVACIPEGFSFVGVDNDPVSIRTAKARCGK